MSAHGLDFSGLEQRFVDAYWTSIGWTASVNGVGYVPTTATGLKVDEAQLGTVKKGHWVEYSDASHIIRISSTSLLPLGIVASITNNTASVVTSGYVKDSAVIGYHGAAVVDNAYAGVNFYIDDNATHYGSGSSAVAEGAAALLASVQTFYDDDRNVRNLMYVNIVAAP
jgi:hypothetical protein